MNPQIDRDVGSALDEGSGRVSVESPVTPRVPVGVTGIVIILAAMWHVFAVCIDSFHLNVGDKKVNTAVSAYIDPELEQNWRLFAPNPAISDISVQVRVKTVGSPAGEGLVESAWANLTEQDRLAVQGGLLPSHMSHTLLRRAAEFYLSNHPSDDGDSSLVGEMSSEYLKRAVLVRLGQTWTGGKVAAIEIQITTSTIAGPAWAGASPVSKNSFRVLPWWMVTESERTRLIQSN